MPRTKKTTMPSKVETRPIVEEGNFSVMLGPQEMLSLIQVLSFSKEIFEKMALSMYHENDEASALMYSARSQLSLKLFEKFKTAANIGEPTSKELH
jgi:hypothetical protein